MKISELLVTEKDGLFKAELLTDSKWFPGKKLFAYSDGIWHKTMGAAIENVAKVGRSLSFLQVPNSLLIRFPGEALSDPIVTKENCSLFTTKMFFDYVLVEDTVYVVPKDEHNRLIEVEANLSDSKESIIELIKDYPPLGKIDLRWHY